MSVTIQKSRGEGWLYRFLKSTAINSFGEFSFEETLHFLKTNVWSVDFKKGSGESPQAEHQAAVPTLAQLCLQDNHCQASHGLSWAWLTLSRLPWQRHCGMVVLTEPRELLLPTFSSDQRDMRLTVFLFGKLKANQVLFCFVFGILQVSRVTKWSCPMHVTEASTLC